MSRSGFVLATILFSASATPLWSEEARLEEGEKLFALDVKPLLAQKCLACHGSDPEKIEGKLNLTSLAGMLRGGESGRAVLKPGEAAASLLYTATTGKDSDYVMPPKENDRLTEEETWKLRDWINAGAPWPDETAVAAIQKTASEQGGVEVRTSGGLSDAWTHRRYKPENLWAYQPLQRTVPPATGAGNPIDAFIDQRLAGLQLAPAPRANRRMLLRRVTFDLLGLPPTPEEMAAFLKDPAPDEEAFVNVVDRLLASPHYGEQSARHWLDVVRYADTSGLANDFERPNAWRYRDYVIRAFNEDKPYDQFVREQLAGDEIDGSDPEMLVAVGFLRMGPWEQTGMSVARVSRQQFLDDVTDTVGQVLLSHPLQCCRCHDHKFDPVPTRDYYALQAAFATTQFAERDAPFLSEENTAGFEQEKKYLEERIARYEETLRQIDAKEEQAARAWYAERGRKYAPRQELVRRGVREEEIAPRHIGLTTEDFGLERIARKNLARHTWELDRFRPIAFSVYNGKTPELKNVQSRLKMPREIDSSGTLEQTAILAGGDPFSPTIPVSPGVLSCVAPDDFLLPADISGRRLALANWIANAKNPLTARSIANRIWQQHFGRGLARNPNNFGAMGKKPTHPELLDFLSAWLVDNGWSIKRLHRLILSSEAYQRSSHHPEMEIVAHKDADGTTYASFPMRRLAAEELRDAMLSASGELNPLLGGIPIRPDMNLEAALQPRQIMGTYAPAYQPSPLPEQRNRRSIYAMRIRGLSDPFFEVFNQPGSDKPCELRDASTVTTQALALFNSEETYDRALALAARLLKETGSDENAIRRAFALTLSRPPTNEEMQACLDHSRQMTRRHEQLTFAPQSPPKEVVRHAIEEMNGEPFTFTERLEIYDDYVPDLKPWQTDPRTRGLAEVCLVLFNSNEFVYVP